MGPLLVHFTLGSVRTSEVEGPLTCRARHHSRPRELNKESTGSWRAIKSPTKRFTSRSRTKPTKVQFSDAAKFIYSKVDNLKLACHALLTYHQPHRSLPLNCPAGHGIVGRRPLLPSHRNPQLFPRFACIRQRLWSTGMEKTWFLVVQETYFLTEMAPTGCVLAAITKKHVAIMEPVARFLWMKVSVTGRSKQIPLQQW